jgi:hypothetical protein
MRIFYSETGDPMLLDRETGLRELANHLSAFLGGAETRAAYPAEVDGDPTPHTEFLAGLRVEKVADGQPMLRISNDRWLELTLTPEDLKRLCSKVAVLDDGRHTHLYAAPLSLIFEADSSWPGFNEA